MSRNVPFSPGAMQTLSGTGIVNTYAVPGAPFQVGLATRVRFYVAVILAGGSPVTTINWKVQYRYNDGAVITAPWLDLPTFLDDVQGAAQPKGNTLELEHTLGSLVAPIASPGTWMACYLDKPQALNEIRVMAKSNATGVVGDSCIIYGQAV
jgi:hypothetical protein